MPDISKLPKWARELLTQKDREIAHLKHQMSLLERQPITNKTDLPDVYFSEGISDMYALPDGAQVTFHLHQDGQPFPVRIYLDETNYKNRVLSIRVEGRMLVLPSASNSINIAAPGDY